MNTHFYGWKRDLPDQRDIKFQPTVTKLPTLIDLRAECPPIYDQGQLGSCTANAISGALDFMRHKQGEAFIFPSRLLIYYNERSDEGTVSSDSGASIRESVKAVVKYGACPETEWPYNIKKFTDKPSAKCYSDAIKYEAIQYQSISRLVAHFQAVLAGGDPFVIGISVYKSFESDAVAKSGMVPMPAHSEELLGGHALCVVGYDSVQEVFIVRNSWGTSWGDKGYCYIPFAYLLNSKLSSDFWTLQKVK